MFYGDSRRLWDDFRLLWKTLGVFEELQVFYGYMIDLCRVTFV